MSAQECECGADEYDLLADSLGPTTDDLRKMLREIAAQWHRLADGGGGPLKTALAAFHATHGESNRTMSSL